MQRLALSNRADTMVPFLAGTMVLIGALAAGAAIGLRPAWAPAVIAVPLVLVAAWAAVRAPGFTFAAYLAIPFYKAATDPYLPVDLTALLAMVNVMQAGFLLMPRLLASGTRIVDPVRRRALLVWFSLTALILLGILYAPNVDFALNRSLNWILLSALPLVAAFRVASDPRFVRQFLWSLFAVGVVVTLVGLWVLPQVGAWPVDRLIVFGAHSIRVGQAALLVPLIGLAYILPTSRRAVQVGCLALMAPALLVSASSGSRGPLITAAATIVVFALRGLVSRLVSGRALTITALKVAVVGLVAALMLSFLQPSAIMTLLPETAVTRLSSVTDIFLGVVSQDLAQSAPDTSTTDRLIAYDGAITMFNRNPIFGGGTASFADFAGSSELNVWTADVAYPHNLVLQFAAEYGIIGLFVLAVILITAFRGLITRGPDPAWSGILVLLVFFLLGAMVSSGIIDNRTLWGLVALGIAANTVSNGGPHRPITPAPDQRGVRPRRFAPPA